MINIILAKNEGRKVEMEWNAKINAEHILELTTQRN